MFIAMHAENYSKKSYVLESIYLHNERFCLKCTCTTVTLYEGSEVGQILNACIHVQKCLSHDQINAENNTINEIRKWMWDQKLTTCIK